MPQTLGIRSNFLGIEPKHSSFERSRVAILPVPYEHTVSYGGGTRKGPEAILDASHYVEFYDEETGREVHRELGVATLRPLRFARGSQSAALKTITGAVESLVEKEKFAVILGGEHTITQATIRPYLERYPDLSVLQIDAHSDLREEYLGNRLSHASVMARVCEMMDPKRIVQVGIRAQCIEEAGFIKDRGITTIYAHKIRAGEPSSRTGGWDDVAIDRLTGHVYVTFDIDGLDPSIMPSTGTPEPNGLAWQEAMQLLRKLGASKTVVGCDLVEFAPIKGLHHADLTAAKLVSKMINYFVPAGR